MANPSVVQAGDSGASQISSGSACSPFGRDGAGGSNVTVSNKVLLFIYTSPGGPVTGVTSSIGTFSYLGSIDTKDIDNPIGSGLTDVEIWACQNATSAAKTVTVSTTGAVNYTASAYEIANAASLTFFGSNSGTSGTSATLAFTGLAIGALCVALTDNGDAVSTAPAGWTSYNGSGGQWQYGNGIDTAYINATASSMTATWTMPSQVWYTIGAVATPMSQLDPLVESYTSTTGIYWALEDASGSTGADSSGNGHALTLSNFTLAEASIVPTDSLTCALLTSSSNGTSSYQPSYSALSVGVFTKFSSLPGGTQYFITNLSGNNGISISVNSSAVASCTIGNGTTTVTVSSPTALISGHEYVIAVTWNGTTVTLYQYDLTANVEATPATASLSGSFTSPTGWTVGNGSLSAYLGRLFILPTALSSTLVGGLATAAGYVAPASNATQGLLMSLL